MKVESEKDKVDCQKQLELFTMKDKKAIGMRKEEKDIHSNITKNRPLTIKL